MKQEPFADVILEEDGFSIPTLKWRELLFVGAMRPDDSGAFVRDPARPLSPFATADLLSEGLRFEAIHHGERVYLRRLPAVV